MSGADNTRAPPLPDEAWKFLEAQNVDALNGGVTFEGDWGNWNWLWAEIYKRSIAEPQATKSPPPTLEELIYVVDRLASAVERMAAYGSQRDCTKEIAICAAQLYRRMDASQR